ncbi:ATP-binding protein [Rhodopirellula sp. MGV]|uniref:ATP-binding protein n=1 Tax=Rhodopirellula sp. MGV TaxID=2023130 RepID=UPI000B979DFA|nr:ATP-binding protein [Rhodopirellula sp. MGV]OYP34571.1 peptide-binding protein [Rhodopirellula sp. MGV]PNY36714.1 peptide-binding protein [Rhodopirellula baltica]
MASLYVVRGRDQGKHFVLSGQVVRIGRDTANDVQLLDGEASRHHAEIRIDGEGGCTLIDLNSSNGTQVNGRPVGEQRLASGDRIEIGGTLLIFTGTGQPTAVDAAHGVDIVRHGGAADASRIVSSFVRPTSRPNVIPFRGEGRGEGNRSDIQGGETIHGESGSSVIAEESPRFETALSEKSDEPIDGSISTLTDTDRSLEVMYLTALAVGRTDDLNELLDRILQLVFDWVDADRGCVMLRDAETGELRPAARCDRQSTGSPQHEAPISISSTILDYVLERAEGVRTSDASDDARFDAAASIVQGGVREALCVPLQGRYDIVGALYIDTYTSPGQMVRRGSTHRFTDEHLRLITAIGHQAALAIEDTFYYSALLQSERLAAMGQTIATLSHHVKNILQGISGGSYLIESGLKRDDTDAVRRGWTIVDRNQERISNLVLDMLTFSKEREPQKVDADLNETVRDVAELMQTRAKESGIVLETCLADAMPEAFFDPDALHQAILNLVTNAIDAVKEQHGAADADSEANSCAGKVDLNTAYDAENGWIVDVIDNGPGIAEEDRQRVFSLFESKKGARGTGLGLPVSAKILKEHGGDLTIVDSPTGVGCCFRMILPPAT